MFTDYCCGNERNNESSTKLMGLGSLNRSCLNYPKGCSVSISTIHENIKEIY